MSCPPLEELLQWLRGSLASERTKTVEAHLSEGCTNCENNRQWLSGILNATAKDDSFEFSEETIQWSVGQFKVLSSMSTARRPILGKLIFDSFRPAFAADVRSAAARLSGRQMLFEADGYEVDLRVESHDGSAVLLLIGQVINTRISAGTAAGIAQIAVQLVGAEEGKKTETDARGMFRFRGVAEGEYGLIISLPEGDLSIYAIPCRTE